MRSDIPGQPDATRTGNPGPPSPNQDPLQPTCEHHGSYGHPPGGGADKSQSFLLLPAPAIDAHKNALCESLGPQVDQLISRSDALVTAQTEHMKRLEERVAILQSAQSSGSAATARLNLAGTESLAGSNSVDERSGEKDGDIGGEDGGSYLDDLDLKEVNMQQRRRIAMLKGKRKKLEEERASLMSSQA